MYGDGGDSEGQKKGFWRADPVHPTPAGYENLLKGVLTSHQELKFNRSYAGGGGNKHQAARHMRRQHWVRSR
jgi:hypothetical protein